MKNLKRNYRSNSSGQVLMVLIIILVLICGGAWYLYSNKAAMDKDAREFGKQAVERLAVNHDAAFFADHLGPQAKLDFPPSEREHIMSKFQELGTPTQPIAIDVTVTFESHFFEPKGYFIAHLNYPARPATLEVVTSHPASRWQLDGVKLSYSLQR
jgi:hypothetical protein